MNKLRGIDSDLANAFKDSELYKLYNEHKNELFLGVRDNYLNLYYNCDNIAKIEYRKRDKSVSCKIDKYFLDGNHHGKNKLVNLAPCEICNSYKDIKKNSDDIIKAKKDKKEKKAQSKLVILNNQNKLSDWFCIDIEYANPNFRGRFDIIAVSKKPPHKTALIELKYGHDAIGGKSGIYEHVKNFIEFRKEGYFIKQMKQEIVSIIKSLDNLGVEIPFEIPEESSILDSPDFYFITLNNNAEKTGGGTPKQTMASYLFEDKRWGCKELSEKYNVQREFKIDVTKENSKFYATFLFSKQKLKKGISIKEGITINDIIDGNYDERIIPNSGMKITIHKGTNQIGGCITEIESSGYKVFIDFGEQLPGTENKELPEIAGLTCGDVSKSALFITHYHGDHIGKICDTVPGLPIYAGKTALEIYTCLEDRLSRIPDPTEAEKHKSIIERIKTIKTFKPLQKIRVGKIIITPLFIDHSAFDAYMFIVEADGKRVLHTGDFRGHGFRSKMLVPVLKKYAQSIDYIISEGSNIQRPDAVLQTEQELQKDFEIQFRKNKYNFVLVSTTNIDRVFALYHAAKRAKRCFICDDFQAELLKIISKSHKKFTEFYDIDFNQKTNPEWRFIELKSFYKREYMFAGNLKPYLNKHGFCMLIRTNSKFKPILDEYSKSDETKIYYSMWKGYLDKSNPAFNQSMSTFIESFKYEYKHTSGHADVKTLNLLFNTVKPKCGIIPIHTEAPGKFKKLFTGHNIILLQDGCVFECR